MTPERIAVTTDFSQHSKLAFPAAALVASKFGAELYVVHVARPEPPGILPWGDIVSYSAPEGFLERVREKLESLVAADPSFQEPLPKSVVLSGAPSTEVEDFVEREDISLLVTATHGYTGVQKLILGSVTEKLIRSVPCPVLTVRGKAGHAEVSRFDPRRILVPYDCSRHSVASLKLAREWAKAFSSQVRVVTVVPDRLLIYHYESGPERFREMVAEIESETRRQVENTIETEWQGRNITLSVRRGQVVSEILSEASSFRADLVILGTHGMTDDDRFPLGRVAEKTIRKAPCPVLSIRRPL